MSFFEVAGPNQDLRASHAERAMGPVERELRAEEYRARLDALLGELVEARRGLAGSLPEQRYAQVARVEQAVRRLRALAEVASLSVVFADWERVALRGVAIVPAVDLERVVARWRESRPAAAKPRRR